MKKRSAHFGSLTTLALGIAAASLSACGGGGSLAPVSATRGGQATGQLRIVIPPAAAARKPSYVSPSTQSISVSIDGGVATFTNLTASSPACTVAGPLQSLTCNVPIVASAGTHSLTIITFDKTQAPPLPLGAGHKLSENTVSATFVAGQNNLVAVTLGGIPASVIISTGPTETTANGGNDTLVLAGPLPKTMIAEALDADGNVIVGPGAPAIAISTTSGTPLVTATAVPVTGNSTFNTNTFTLTPTGLGITSLTLTATQIGSGGATVSATIPTTVSQILTVANAGTNSVTEYVPWTNAPAVTITSGISAPIAIVGDAKGTLYVLDSTAGIQEYTNGGTTLTRTITSGLSGPDAMALDSNGTLYVANTKSSTITEYVAGATTVSGTISTGIDEPSALAIDTSNNLYVANYGNNSVTVYAAGAVAPSSTITSGVNGPFGLALNAADAVFVANLAGNNITTYPAGKTTSAVTFVGTSFADSTPLTTPRTPLAVDATGKLYAVNYTANDVTTYTIATGPNPTTTIASDMNSPLSTVLDNVGNLYVANATGTINANGTISAYAGGGQVNTRTLGGGATVTNPTAVFPLGP